MERQNRKARHKEGLVAMFILQWFMRNSSPKEDDNKKPLREEFNSEAVKKIIDFDKTEDGKRTKNITPRENFKAQAETVQQALIEKYKIGNNSPNAYYIPLRTLKKAGLIVHEKPWYFLPDGWNRDKNSIQIKPKLEMVNITRRRSKQHSSNKELGPSSVIKKAITFSDMGKDVLHNEKYFNMIIAEPSLKKILVSNESIREGLFELISGTKSDAINYFNDKFQVEYAEVKISDEPKSLLQELYLKKKAKEFTFEGYPLLYNFFRAQGVNYKPLNIDNYLQEHQGKYKLNNRQIKIIKMIQSLVNESNRMYPYRKRNMEINFNPLKKAEQERMIAEVEKAQEQHELQLLEQLYGL